MNRFATSKFRNAVGTEGKRELWFSDLRVNEDGKISSNDDFLAFSWILQLVMRLQSLTRKPMEDILRLVV